MEKQKFETAQTLVDNIEALEAIDSKLCLIHQYPDLVHRDLPNCIAELSSRTDISAIVNIAKALTDSALEENKTAFANL